MSYLNYTIESNKFQSKTYRNQRFLPISQLCDRLLFEQGYTLSELETKVLGQVAGRYRGNASQKKLAIISKCANRVGLKVGGNI